MIQKFLIGILGFWIILAGYFFALTSGGRAMLSVTGLLIMSLGLGDVIFQKIQPRSSPPPSRAKAT